MGLAMFAWASASHAQTGAAASAAPPGPSVPAVVPPKLIQHEPPEYPASAKGDAEVILVVVVRVDGTVGDVTVEKGAEPFAAVARETAKKFKYTPATRAGKPVSAKVRALVTFHEPPREKKILGAEPDELPPKPGTTPAASAAPAARPQRVEEVRVVGQRKEPGMTATLKRSEVRELPGTFGDPFRALEVMPGVTPIISGLPFFYVRGSPPGNVGYYLDGVRVPYLYHVGLGPSVVHPGIVERVDLYGGGYPARYGRFAGGMVTAETEPPRKDAHAEWNVRLVDAGVLAETGFAGDRGTILVGGRYSYTAALISLAAPNALLDYRDFQLRATYDVSPVDTITLFSFGAYDIVGEYRNGVRNVAFGAEFYRADMRWDRKLPEGARLRTAVTLGLDRSLLGEDRVARNRSVATRVEWTKPVSDRVLVRAGADTVFERYDTELLGEDPEEDAATARAFGTRSDMQMGLRGDVVYKPARDFEVIPGLRLDLFSSGGVAAVGVDPRIASRWAVSKKVRLLQAHGIAHQPPSFVGPIPGLTIGSLSGGLQRGLHTSAGVEADLPAEFLGSVTAFRQVTLNLTDFLTSAARFDGTEDERVFDRRATGDTYGLEVFVRRPLTRRVAALMSYTLSRATQRQDGKIETGAFDRTHVFNIAGAFDLGARWRFGTKFVAYTGSPMLFRQRDSGIGSEGVSIPSGARSKPFYRLDFRLEKKWMLGKRANISVVLEVINTLLNKETINDDEIGPITIPSLGVEGEL